MASILNDKLSLYLLACSAKQFHYGAYDCGQFVVEWIIENGIVAEFPYKNAREAARVIRTHGGFAEAGHAVLTGFGLITTDVSRRGDIGLLKFGHNKLIFALSTGKNWVSPAESGLMNFRGIPQKIWRLP